MPAAAPTGHPEEGRAVGPTDADPHVLAVLAPPATAAVMTSVAVAAQRAWGPGDPAGELAAPKAGDITIAGSRRQAIRLAATELPVSGAGPALLRPTPWFCRPRTFTAVDTIWRGARPSAVPHHRHRRRTRVTAWLERAARSTEATVTPTLVPDAVTGAPAVQLAVLITCRPRRPLPGAPPWW
jgi:hypothetical protein